MFGTQRKSRGWKIPSCIIGALLGIALTTGYSTAGQLRYDTSGELDYGQQFQRVLNSIRANSVNVEGTASEEELFNIAIDAILKEIGDEHGAYFSQEEYSRFSEDISPQSYGGIGIQLSVGSGGLVILNIFDNSPLKNMTIREGDIIQAAGSLGEPMVVWDTENLKEMVEAIKGPVGTDVSLKMKRGSLDIGVITVTRIAARNQLVYMKLAESGILTIRITQFSGTIYDDLMKMLHDRGWIGSNHILDTSIIKGVVLDLRNNPGGILGQAIEVSDLFLPRDDVAVRVISRPEIEGGPATVNDFITSEKRLFPVDIPRVILINGGSASASEIVAGAVQLHKEGLIMGIKSYGKGSVQTIMPLPGGTAIKTTTAIYLAGGTVEIDGIGVMPDSVVLQPDTIGYSADDRRVNSHLIKISMDPEIDHQLNVAHEYIKAFITGGHSLTEPVSRQHAENMAHGAKTLITKTVCKAKGLRNCNTPRAFEGSTRFGNRPGGE
jgi:carboxyl-terminal processing protease